MPMAILANLKFLCSCSIPAAILNARKAARILGFGWTLWRAHAALNESKATSASPTLEEVESLLTLGSSRNVFKV